MRRDSKCILFLIMLLLPLTLPAQNKQKVKFDVGFKGGVQAGIYKQTELTLDGYKYNNKSQNTRIGYTLSSFFRLTKGRTYIQTEGTFSIDKHNFSFERTIADDTENAVPRYRLTTYSVKVPLLIGYNFVDSEPYRMGFFTGPKAKFLFTSLSEQQFDNFNFQSAKEYLDPLTFSWVVGLEVGIANLCFDFVYQVGMNNASKYIYIPETGNRFHFNRNINILSFSLGVTL